jgi:nucleoside-diphosphate-sugar epimerase
MSIEVVFLAGATGAIGQRLVPLLVQNGRTVFGTTRRAGRLDLLRSQGARPVQVDALDADALREAVRQARPDAVIHQLTDLPPALDPAAMPAASARNAHLREVGTRNLVAAALAAGARRMVAQSIAFVYAAGPQPWDESAPLEVDPAGPRALSMRGVIALEDAVLHTPGIDGVVLRYGQLYGPGTGRAAPQGNMPVHVDAAAYAALLALERGAPGIYNIVEDGTAARNDKAKRELRWNPAFRSADAERDDE